MALLNTRTRYGSISLALHWIIVLAIVAQWLLAEMEVQTLHQSLGLSVLLLAIVRLAWRLFNPTPAWPIHMKPYEITLARLVHVAFYVLLFAIPISGWALSSAEDEPLRLFGWFDVPRLAVSNEETLEEVHEVLFNVLSALALVHIAGAAKHWWAARSRRISSNP